ncbi:MAG: hypothetical protein WD069_01875 [Planctomycetales bacterium]
MAKHHPNKAINAAIEYALENGWRFVRSGARSHAHGKLYCPAGERGGHIFVVRGTPRTPDLHARRIREAVDDCEHETEEPEGGE